MRSEPSPCSCFEIFLGFLFKTVWIMFRCTSAFAFALLCAMVIASSAHPMSNHCVSLKETRFEMCISAGYDKTFPFENDFTEAEQQEVAREFTEILKSMKNCSHDGLAELIECSLFVPKCNMLGEPVYPCRQACAEYLRRCEYELSKHALDYLIPWCLLLSNGSVGHAPCFQPSNFTANESAPGKWSTCTTFFLFLLGLSLLRETVALFAKYGGVINYPASY